MKGRRLWRDFAARFPGAGSASVERVLTSSQVTGTVSDLDHCSRDVFDLKQSPGVMEGEEMHEQLSGPYVMFLQLICAAIEVARH